MVIVNETVCESDGSAKVCVQLRTVTEREVTASVQPSDLSTQSECCIAFWTIVPCIIDGLQHQSIYTLHVCMHVILILLCHCTHDYLTLSSILCAS